MLANVCLPVLIIVGNVVAASAGNVDENTLMFMSMGMSIISLVCAVATMVMAICGLAKMGKVLMGPWWVLIIPGMLIPCFSLVFIIILIRRQLDSCVPTV